jgi:O-acetyl-ADP-ribose deacetylase (regulator of RNase III)
MILILKFIFFKVDGAIHKAAGRQLVQETMQLDGCETGQTKISRAYKMPSKYVLHTVGPIGEHPSLLKSCYKTTLQLSIDYNIRTIVFFSLFFFS